MSAINYPDSLASVTIYPERTTSGNSDDLTRRQETTRNREKWEILLNNYLVEWGREQIGFEEEDMVPPSPDILDRACRLAIGSRDRGAPAPIRVVPDGEGGISFEWRLEETFFALNLYAGRPAEWLVFENCILKERIPFG